MKILLIDDHALFRSGLRHLLSELDSAVEIVEAGSREEAVVALAGQDYDLVLTGLVMPGMEREGVVATLRAINPAVPIVAVSMLEGVSHIRAAMAAGAVGFIPKSTTPEIMIEAIKLVLSGSVYLPPTVLQVEAAAAAAGQQLSRRQAAVLAELVRGKSNKEIAYALNLSKATVKVHVAAIMRAFNAHNRTQAVIAAVRQGGPPPTAPCTTSLEPGKTH